MSKFLLIILMTFLIVAGVYWFFEDGISALLMSQNDEETQISIQSLSLKGSNTVGESFAPQLAKAFLKQQGAKLIRETPQLNPVEKIVEGFLQKQNTSMRVDIKAHGSSLGFTALVENSTDIAMSSRAIKPSEFAKLTAQFGLVQEYPIALDALAIITYSENSIEALTIKQLAHIFSGEVTNWNQIGGLDQPIKLFSRDQNSGTWDTFKTLVLKPFKLQLATNSTRYESSNSLVADVKSTVGAIGFVGVAYVNQAKLLSITSNIGEKGSLPNGYTIGTQAYPLSRKLYLYTVGKDVSPLALAFIEFVSMNEGQKIANEAGLVSYYPTQYRPKRSNKNVPNVYQTLLSIGRRITVDFSGNIEHANQVKEQRDIERLLNFAKQNPGRKLVLVDFSNSPRLSQLKQSLEKNQLAILDTLNLDYTYRNESDIEVWVL